MSGGDRPGGLHRPDCAVQQVSALRAQFPAGAVTDREAFTVRIVLIKQVSALRAQLPAGAVTAREVFTVRIVLIKQVNALCAQLPAGASKSKPIIADGSATKGHEQ